MSQGSLFRTPPGKVGPVYQGVAAQFRALFPTSDPDAKARKAAVKGWTSMALSHARAMDADPRASVGRAQVSAELRECLVYIAEATASGDAFDAFLEELRSGHTRAPAPHPED